MNEPKFITGAKVKSADVRATVRPIVVKDSQNPFVGVITRVTFMNTADSSFPIHYGGATGPMHKYIGPEATWADEVEVVQNYYPVDPNQALLNRLLAQQK